MAPSYTGKNITRLLPLALLLVLRTCSNTDGNKLVIFSGTASYYGDNYIISRVCCCLYCCKCAALVTRLEATKEGQYGQGNKLQFLRPI